MSSPASAQNAGDRTPATSNRAKTTAVAGTLSRILRLNLSTPLRGYVIAATAVIAAALVRALLDRWLDDAPPFVIFVIPVLIAAWYGGTRAGLFATALSLATGWYLFVPPKFYIFKGNVDIAFRLAIFVMVGNAIAIFCSRLRHSQAEAQQNEARFKSTFENAAVGIAHIGHDGRWLRVNGRLCEILGYSAANLEVQTVLAVTAPEDRPLCAQALSQTLLAEKKSHAEELRFSRQDGSVVWVNVTLSAQRDKHHVQEYFIAVIEDISTRRRAEEALRINLWQLQATFDGMVQPAMLAGADGDILAVNSAWVSLFNPEGTPVHRSDWLDNFEFRTAAGAPLEPDQLPFERALAGEVVRDLDLTGRHKATGQIRHFIAGASPVTDAGGKVLAVIATAQDITRRKQTEEELIRSNSVLRQFAYAAAHDLQEPLRNVAISSELLARKYAGQLDERADQLLTTSVEGARRMHRMVQDLLSYTEVIDTKSAVVPLCNSEHAFAQALANVRQAIDESAAEIVCEPLPHVRVLETHAVQVFQNLISNSLKYRRRDQRPLVHVSVQQSGSHHTFSVADNGIGFDPAHAEQIFWLFRRLHTHGDYPGTGIGLAICARIVEHYGGRIWAEASPGSGATFKFTLPGSGE